MRSNWESVSSWQHAVLLAGAWGQLVAASVLESMLGYAAIWGH
jgi:hypothetical protein